MYLYSVWLDLSAIRVIISSRLGLLPYRAALGCIGASHLGAGVFQDESKEDILSNSSGHNVITCLFLLRNISICEMLTVSVESQLWGDFSISKMQSVHPVHAERRENNNLVKKYVS